MATKIYNYTKALCPVCTGVVNAQIIESENKVYLKKYCPQHGTTLALICSDSGWYQSSISYVKPGQVPKNISIPDFKGCPESCGLCPEHQQHTCLPVIEINSDCDLNCPVCLKKFKKSFKLSVSQFTGILTRLKECEEEVHVINLSGGEPTLHPDFEKFLQLANEHSLTQVTVSTNGLNLLKNSGLRSIFKETGTIAAVQFDGFLPETYSSLRGADLAKQKQKLIELLEKEEIRYSLVSTIVKGINDHEITNLVNFFFISKALSLMFQPAAFTGRARVFGSHSDRITIPDVVREIEKSNFTRTGDFNPLPCSHFSCFALSYYFDLGDNKYLSLKDFLGKEQYLNIIANKTLPGLDQSGFSVLKEKIYEFWSAADSADLPAAVLQRIKRIFNSLNDSSFSAKEIFKIGSESMKAIFIHQFMDLDTFDFGRLIKCCNHYPLPDGRMIPMCAQNVFFQ